ncbi:hypothetical protein [Oceanobacillus polygoni]|uniref:Uncharacterized protein n=1 Tax=Oceanobacillus polygoni TaxID=1235259 RepID=A0A9X0YQA5_9BACI|nr:hypothetical protein [Oceanobacillus polygoni]MBP2076832.1 hypothetical protein [Oceanobacillus polygoni]
MKEKKIKLGWFGWTMIGVVLITVIASSLFFFNVFQLDMKSLFRDDELVGSVDQNDISEEAMGEINRVRATIGGENAELGRFIRAMHEFYNKTTGYGGINNLDWDEQREQAETVIDRIEGIDTEITDESLLADLKQIVDLANRISDEQDSELIRSLHRYFHDLDIALNNYTTFDRIWNVTETLKGIE